MTKIVVTDGYSYPGETFDLPKKVCEQYGFDFEILNCRNEEELAEQAKDADGLLVVYSDITESLLQKLPKCKVVVRFGVGVDTVDMDACSKHGVLVCNVPDYGVGEVASHAFSLILALERKVALYDRAIRSGRWDDSVGYPIKRLKGQILGFVGFGRIARQTAEYAKVFGFDIVAYDPFLPDTVFEENNVKRVNLDELYKISDVISIMVPCTEDTFHLLNTEAFNKMKDDVLIVNTARGPIISYDDLVDALKQDKIGAVGLDVIEGDPLKDTSMEIFSFENVVLTPHVGYKSNEFFADLKTKTAEAACKVLSGEKPFNILNKAAIETAKAYK